MLQRNHGRKRIGGTVDARDKTRLHQLLLDALKAELEATLKAAEVAREGATHEDAVAKSKYDTHGLELSYLAGSQFERARQMEAKITLLESNPFRMFGEDDEIDVGALVTLRASGKTQSQSYLISNIGAGLDLDFDGRPILVISPESPLGSRLVTRYAGELIENKNLPTYEILGIS